jgi:hypothetical protein
MIQSPITPSLHHSITPSLHHSITPSLHHSITPSLRCLYRHVDMNIRRSYSPFALKGGVAKWEGRGLQNRYERVRFSPPPLPFRARSMAG